MSSELVAQTLLPVLFDAPSRTVVSNVKSCAPRVVRDDAYTVHSQEWLCYALQACNLKIVKAELRLFRNAMILPPIKEQRLARGKFCGL